MHCKFLQNGLAIDYNQVVKPCCIWRKDDQWRKDNLLTKVDLSSWHKSLQIQNLNQQLSQNSWPTGCSECQRIENDNRVDSMRGSGNQAYSHYQESDITLEIRPGNTCNFACQTCWPEASSRVAQFQQQAGLIKINSVDNAKLKNFEFLLPIASRLKDVVLLGGEPFYDRSCRAFIQWAQQNISANLTMFTNGSCIDFDFLENYRGKITLVFSIDAVGKSAEYIRYGCDWETVLNNYLQVRSMPNVETRVNVTCSVYNYSELPSVIQFLSKDWPSVVSFGAPIESWMRETTIPIELRPQLIAELETSARILAKSNIEHGQKHNAVKAMYAIIKNLRELPWSSTNHRQWCNFVQALDTAKNAAAAEYVPILKEILNFKIS